MLLGSDPRPGTWETARHLVTLVTLEPVLGNDLVSGLLFRDAWSGVRCKLATGEISVVHIRRQFCPPDKEKTNVWFSSDELINSSVLSVQSSPSQWKPVWSSQWSGGCNFFISINRIIREGGQAGQSGDKHQQINLLETGSNFSQIPSKHPEPRCKLSPGWVSPTTTGDWLVGEQ